MTPENSSAAAAMPIERYEKFAMEMRMRSANLTLNSCIVSVAIHSSSYQHSILRRRYFVGPSNVVSESLLESLGGCLSTLSLPLDLPLDKAVLYRFIICTTRGALATYTQKIKTGDIKTERARLLNYYGERSVLS